MPAPRHLPAARWGLVGAAGAALVGLVVAVVQLRTGVIPMLDTATYWSGARATADGHPFTTTLAPSFTNFTAAEFLQRDGRLPFVDFPVGYPTLAGVLAIVAGAERAMGIVTALAMAATAGLTVVGTRATNRTTAAWRAVLAFGIVALPVSRLVTQAALSEPLFVAVVLGLVATLLHYRDTGRCWPLVVCLAMAAGLLRFVGAPLSLLAGLEHWRRERRPLAAAGWTALALAPAAANMVAAAAAGGGHAAGWRGLGGDDVELMARSVGGWFDASQGDLRLTYFGGDGATWWAWPLFVGWMVLVAWAAVGLVLGNRSGNGSGDRAGNGSGDQAGDRAGERDGAQLRRLPATLELCLAAAGILTVGLVLGMAGFDALVIADNRLMLPAGVLSLVGVVWSVQLPSARTESPAGRVVVAAAGLLAVAWLAVAVEPWQLTERFSDLTSTPPYVAAAAGSGADIVIVNDADGVHWATGLPAAYAPLPVKSLTGELVDMQAAYRALPCPMLEHDGVVIITEDALFGTAGAETLDELVAEGRLVAEPIEGGFMYRPTPTSCGER